MIMNELTAMCVLESAVAKLDNTQAMTEQTSMFFNFADYFGF